MPCGSSFMTRISTPVDPPRHLSKRMKDWWRTVALEHQLESHHYLLLEVACGAWDAMEAARKEIAKEGTS